MPTNIYDVTQPFDTQAANQLGLDLRNLALNVQQRMALISGTTAARWNPGTDAQPFNWIGLLYFATDTNKVWQWAGNAWVDITASIGSATNFPRQVVSVTNVISSSTPFVALYNPPSPGLFRLSYNLLTTIAGSGTCTLNFVWNNGVIAANINSNALLGTSLGAETQGQLVFWAFTSLIGFTVNSSGSFTYRYSVSLERLI
jgi:hypothetical protein